MTVFEVLTLYEMQDGMRRHWHYGTDHFTVERKSEGIIRRKVTK